MESTEEEEEEEEMPELPPLDYARQYGLSTPYFEEELFVGDLPTPPNDNFDQDPWDPPNASTTNMVTALIKERLAVSTYTVLLLQAVHDFCKPPPSEAPTLNLRRHARFAKQELPILRTDNELDMLSFGSTAMPDLTKLNIPSEVVKEEDDEGFKWPTKYLTYPAQCDAQIKSEKMAVSRDVLVYLQDAVTDSYSPEHFDKLKEQCLSYKPNAARRPITPPLLYLTPPPSPYVPSSPANRLPLPSDSSDSVAVEAQGLQLMIMEADSLTRKCSDSSDSMLMDATHPPEFSPPFERQKTTILKRRAEDLKVEGPLTPPTFSTSPLKKLKSVSFPDILHQFIPEAPWVAKCSDDEDAATNSFFDEAFRDIEPFATQALAILENEQLSGADTTARMDVPHIDFKLPIAPWNEYSQTKGGKHRPGDTELLAQTKFLLRVKREDLKTATTWHGVSSLERQLDWSIFTTKISKINLDEQLHGDTDFAKVLAELTTGAIATSSAQVWKPDGLRILDAGDDEDEIEPAETEERRDMEALIRKRRLEIEEEVPQVSRKRASLSPQPITQPSKDVLGSHHWKAGQGNTHAPAKKRSQTYEYQDTKTQAAQASRHKSAKLPQETATDLMFGGFSATSALYKFMESQGVSAKPAEPKNPVANSIPERSTILVVRSREPSSEHAASREQHKDASSMGKNGTNLSSRPRSPLVALPDNLAPCSFIVSSAFLQRRSLTKQIEQLYAAAEIVYRDYELPHSPAQEADVYLSPSTGLLLTTLQQIKQRPLPGEVDRSPTKERIRALQLRCERLVVVVSEGLSREMEDLGSSRPDDPRDKEALASFEGFASQLEGEVIIRYVRGGEQALARSIVVEMAKHGLQHGSKDIGTMKPLAVETTWEIFLRRAGLNPFAAQIIAASLQKPINVRVPPDSTSVNHPRVTSVDGLSAFLTMSEEQRISRFQALMGGSRILRQVSRAVDQEWVSAAHGFRM